MSSIARQIVHSPPLRFADNAALQRYYEEKYRSGGYEGGGVLQHGVDISAMYHARRQAAALRLLRPAADQTVLDAGCGNGSLAARLAPLVHEAHAVDIAANALDPRFTSIANLRFRPMNVEAMEFPDARFDGIVCVETLEHMLHPLRALQEFHRVLKPGGSAVITYPTINRTIVKQLGLGRPVSISEHLNEWSYAELRAVVRDTGFTVEEVEGIAFDLGLILLLKSLNPFFALNVTRASLALRGFPRNSMFVALRLRRK